MKMIANYKSNILAKWHRKALSAVCFSLHRPAAMLILLVCLSAAAYAAPGDLDLSFSSGGKVITSIGGYHDYAQSVAIQADGKIVAVGITGNESDFYDFALARYQGGSNANIRTRFDFDGDGKADVSVFPPSNGGWYLNQSTTT